MLTVTWAHAMALWTLTQTIPSSATVATPDIVVQAALVSMPEPASVPMPVEAPPEVAPKPAKAAPAARKPTPTTERIIRNEPASEAPVESTVLATAPGEQSAPSGWSTPAAPTEVAAPPPAAPVIELPSSKAAYLDNPSPPYPSMSKRLGEQGTVLLRVMVGIDGKASEVQVKRSSGYERLDHTALKTVQGWTFRPGTRNGTPEPMWYDVPIVFQLG